MNERPADLGFAGDRQRILAGAYETILEQTPGRDLAGTEETPERCARAWAELTGGYAVDVAALFKSFDSNGYDEMVVLRDIPFVSLCEHHLLPFAGVAHVAYIPDGRIVGLSKMARLVDAYARRLQVQERLTVQVADAIVEHLAAVGVMVVTAAEHSCIACRGVRKPGVRAVMSAIRGAISEKPEARAEALSLLGL